jgi:hypothetical protein
VFTTNSPLSNATAFRCYNHASVIANKTVKQQRSRAIDMHFYWIYTMYGKVNLLLNGGKKSRIKLIFTRNITQKSIILLFSLCAVIVHRFLQDTENEMPTCLLILVRVH